MLSLAEELLLVALHDERGAVVPAATLSLGSGLAAAVLMDLSLRGRLLVEGRHLLVNAAAPAGDTVLDLVLARMRHAPKRSIAYWLGDLADTALDVRGRLLDRLVRRRVLTKEERAMGAVFPQNDAAPERDVRRRVREALSGDAPVDARTRMLIVLLDSCDLIDQVVEPSQRAAASKRARAVGDESGISEAVHELVDGAAQRQMTLRQLKAIQSAIKRMP